MPIKERKILKTKRKIDAQRKKKRWLQFVENLKILYEGFMKVAFEPGLEGYNITYFTLRQQFSWMDFNEWKCKMQ